MASLIGTTVASNYQKVSPSSLFGTRELTFVKVVADNGGDSDIDFTEQEFEITGATAGAYTGTYSDANSYFSRAVRALQGFAELYFIGTPDATSFVVAIAGDTANDGTASDYSSMEAAIKAAVGIGNKTPVASAGFAYNGEITVTELAAEGAAID